MKKILVTDLFGTLIADDNANEMLYYYGDGSDENITSDYFLDKVFEKSLINLIKFLDNGNDVYLVTSFEGHDCPSTILTKVISRFYDKVKDYKDNVHIFLSGKSDTYLLRDLESVSTKIGEDHYVFGNFDFYKIPGKEYVFDFVLSNHKLYQEKLFVIGNSETDLPMLIKGIELGGQSSIIDNQLWRFEPEMDLNYLINKEVYAIVDDLDDDLRIYTERMKLYQQLRDGSLEYEDLLKSYKVKNLLHHYNFNARFCFPRKQEIESNAVKKLTVYPTFTDYNNRFLK